MKRRDSILQNYYMSRLPKAQGGLTAPSISTTPKSSSTMDFTGSAGTINSTATNCPENYEFDQSTGQCRPIITLQNVNVFSPRKYGQITQNLGPGVGQFTYRGNLATGAPKQSMNDFSKPIIGRGLPGLDRQIRMGDLLANHRIASNEQIGRNFQIEQQIRARDIENNYNILRNTPGLKLYSDQELQRYAQQSKDKWPKFVQQNFDEESNTVYNVVNHPDYNPSVPVSSQRNLADDNSLRTMFLRGRNKMFGEFDRMNPVVGTALKVLASPGSSAANLMFDQQNRYLNPNQSVGQNLLNLGLDVASVAPIPVAQGVGTGIKTAANVFKNTAATVGRYANAPLTIGSRVYPTITANNLLASGFAAKSATDLMDPTSDVRQNPNALNIASTALGFVGLPYGAGAASLIDDAARAGTYLTTQTPLQYTYKINPWAFKEQQGMLYRGIGEKGLQDAMNIGFFRGRQNVPRVNFPGTNLNASKSFGNTTYWSPNLETASRYGEGIVAQVPKDVTKFLQKYRKNDWSQFTTNPISAGEATFLKKDWLRGYKKIENPYNLNAEAIDRALFTDGSKGLKFYANNANKLASQKRAFIKQFNEGKITEEELNIAKARLDQQRRDFWNQMVSTNLKNEGINAFDAANPLSGGSYTDYIFPLKNYPNLLAKISRYPSFEDPQNLVNIGRKFAGSDQVFLPTGVQKLNKNRYLTIMPKAPGQLLGVRGSNIAEGSIPRRSVAEMLLTLRNLQKKGISADYAGYNFLYNPETQKLGAIDLNTTPIQGLSSFGDEFGLMSNRLNVSIPKAFNERFGYYVQPKPFRPSVKGSILPEEITGENIGNVVNLYDDIARGTGNFNYGIYPFIEDPNLLLKLSDPTAFAKFSGDNNIFSGLPEALKGVNDDLVAKIIKEYNLTNQRLTLPAQSEGVRSILNRNPDIPIIGQVMNRIPGKNISEYTPEELGNMPPEYFQQLLDRLRMLQSKGVVVDQLGDNLLLNLGNKGTKGIGIVDLSRIPNANKGVFDVSTLFGLNPNTREIAPNAIKQSLYNKFMRGFNESVNRAGVGAYGDEELLQLMENIKRGAYGIKKSGGPIVNQRGFMDGAPPKGSNWRIMGDGRGTSITMDLPNMPDEILVVPDGEFDQAKVMKQGDEEYFMGADFVDEYLLKGGGLTPNKAREILHDKEVHGRPLTEKQRRYFGAMSKGHTKTYQLGGKTDDEKRALAKRAVEIARRRAEQGQWVSVPQSIQDAAEKLGEPSNSCIGGVCDVLKEANVIPNVIWSNTEFARLAPSLGFNAANRGWGLKGIENLEPGDVVQWMDPNEKNPNKAVPHHGQIYLGTNSKGELEFFDNFSETIKSYPRERIEEQLSWTRKPAESQMQIYKINPYNPKPGNVNPEAQKALEEREANIKYQTGYRGALPEYEYSLRPDSPYINNPPVGMVKFLEKANDSGFIDDLVKSIDKAGYAKRATREQIHDSLLNVFGILGQENKWENPWVGGDITGGSSPVPIPLESTVERIASPSSMSIGPGQIKFSQISKAVKKAFGINRRQDLQNWDKVIPLMVGMDIANKQWMENQGERFSERVIGQPGLKSTEFKWEEGRMSPYFWRGPGIKNIRKYVESLYGVDWYDKFKPQYMQATEEMEEDPAKREQFVKDNIRQYQLVFDPGSYGQRVFENINKNLQRKILRKGEIDIEAEPMDAISLQEVILNSKRTPRRQLGGNALGMLRDYGGGMSVPPLYKSGGQHGGLDRWFAEKWVDVKTGKPCGRQEGESRAYPACRPSKRVSSKTPKTSSELSSAEREKFKRSKTSSERIPYSHKRRK